MRVLEPIPVYYDSTHPPNPINVRFESLNLMNSVHWRPGKGTPDGTSYTVQFALYADILPDSKLLNWRPVARCEETERTWCDLSSQTWDFEQGYYARVRAISPSGFSEWVETRRFHPKFDTVFGQPEITLEVKENTAIVHLTAPVRYQPDERAPPISMATLYPQMTFNLSVQDTRQDQVHHFTVTTNVYKYRLRSYDTDYCFSAKVRFLYHRYQCNQSEKHCITTGKDPVTSQVQSVVVGIVVPSLFICIFLVVGYVLYHYLRGNGQKKPDALNFTVLQIQPFALPDSVIRPLREENSSDDDDDKDNNASDFGLSCAAPRPQEPPVPEETCDYGSVVATVDVQPQESHIGSYMPQEQSKHPTENKTDFPTPYLANSFPNSLKMPVKDMLQSTGSSYRMRNEDVQTEEPPSESYAVLVPSGADQDEAGLVCNWDPQKRELVLPGLETALLEPEGEGERKKGVLKLEKVHVRQLSQEEQEALTQEESPAGWVMEDFTKKYDLQFN
nr:interleukin-20 receptor subunit alpha-like [Nerophis lumbriciformis]